MSLLCGLAGRRERITTALALFALGVDQWMTGATVTPDATRFARSDRAVRTTTPAESGRRLLPVAPGHFDPSEAAVAVVNWRAVAAFAGGVGINVLLGFGLGDRLWHVLPLTGAGLHPLLPLARRRAPRAAAAAPVSVRVR